MHGDVTLFGVDGVSGQKVRRFETSSSFCALQPMTLYYHLTSVSPKNSYHQRITIDYLSVNPVALRHGFRKR